MKHTIIHTETAPAAIGPYSQGVRHQDTFYFSGQIPLTAQGELVYGDIQTQTKQVIANIAALLESQNLTVENVIKTTCFLVDMADFAGFNEIYSAFFTNKPARSCVAVHQLPKNVLVEIEVIAAL